MANWCTIELHIWATTDEGAKKIYDRLIEEQKKAADQHLLMFFGSDRYLGSPQITLFDSSELLNLGMVDVLGEVRWGMGHKAMVNTIKWLHSLADINHIDLTEEEGGNCVFGRYDYNRSKEAKRKYGKLTYRYIPVGKFPDFKDGEDTSWYDKLLKTLETEGVTEEIDMATGKEKD